ncbi:MAG: hypothetical protein O2820_00570 [Planctomycetota bacterium]|nr:hypothetical protein [Planctomycetota bacterium]MDA1247688.1 hypothetical protein [Planctomycetota bacterium]
MRSTHPFFVNVTLAAVCLTSFCGCPADQPVDNTGQADPLTSGEATATDPDKPVDSGESVTDKAGAVLDTATAAAGSTWNFVSEKTSAGLTVFGNTVGKGKDQVVDSSTAAWVWSKDKSTDGWKWVRENATDATEWATDSASEMWTVTRNETGEFALWVKVEAKEGIAWAKTSLPAAWKVTKDAAGDAWVWVGEHKVAMTVAATVVAVVVASLIASPEVAAVAAIKGAISGGSRASLLFLVAAWKDRDPNLDLKTVTENLFTSIGVSVLAQSGPQILSSMSGDEAADAS